LSQKFFTKTAFNQNSIVLCGAWVKKTAAVVSLIICAIFSLLAVESQLPSLVRGNAVWPIGSIDIDAQEIFHSSTITLNYSAVFPVDFDDSVWMRKWIVYSLDGAENVTVYDEYNDLKFCNGSFTLSGLSFGRHKIDIYSKNGTFLWGSSSLSGWRDADDRACFTVIPSSTPTTTPEPAVTPYGEADVQNESQYLAAGGIMAITAVVLAAGLGLLYRIKKK
jgi:hypothetical protein